MEWQDFRGHRLEAIVSSTRIADMLCAGLGRYPYFPQLCELSAARGFASLQHVGYLDLCVSCLYSGLNLVSCFLGRAQRGGAACM